jgi:hypothetical protein
MFLKIDRVATACLLLASLGACSELDRATDCRDICSRYKDCIQRDYDTEECEKRCNGMESDRATREISRCEDCLDDRACTKAVFNCGEECSPIVP